MKNSKPHAGLFLCRCGTNISNFVDLDAVEKWARGRDDIGFVKTHDLLCSPAGKQFVKNTLEQSGADSVIIAACSPKMHEKTFQETAAAAGTNIARVQMANIREQCGWVTSDKGLATAKARDLISAALKRCALHENLEQNYMECNTDIVIIGGGIAGIEAALTAANAGRTVTIVERDISLGGALIRTEEVAPQMECAPCLLAPRLSALKEKKNIRVISNADVTAVLGFFGNFTVKVRERARYVKQNCIGCEACFEACPVSAPSAFHLGMGNRKAIYTAFPGSVPAAAVIDRAACRHFTNGSCDACVAACPFQSIDFNDTDKETQIQAGAIIVATGWQPPAAVDELPDNIFTTVQFERMAASNGPFGGTIARKDGRKPGSVAVLHCAGSLADSAVPYCSGVCCLTALKVGEMVRKQVPDAKIYNFHDRLVLNGPGAEEFYRRQIKEGTQFIKVNDLASLAYEIGTDHIILSTDLSTHYEVDMVILSTGMVPAAGADQLAATLDVERDNHGFFKPDHPILHATGASLDGIYAAGCCASPCDASTAITRAQAAAGDALAKLVPGKRIELEMMTSIIDSELCAGCKLCISVCPYKAISFDAEKNVSVINEAICRGCGTCAATCPSRAAQAKHFTNQQIYAELEGVIHG